MTTISPDSQWYPYAHGGITVEMSSDAVIRLPATTLATSNYGGFQSVLRFDLRGERVVVEVLQTTSTATTAETDIQLVSPEDDTVSLSEVNGNLLAAQYIGGTGSPLAMTPYNAAEERWWAFREDAGTLFFETSPDGFTYTAFYSMPAPAFVMDSVFIVEAGSFESVMNGGAGVFDNVNGGTPTGNFCPASTLRDDFSAGTIGDQWAGSYTSGCTDSQSGGQFSVALGTAAGEECSLRSGTAFDLTNDAVFAEVTAAPGIAQTYVVLRASVLSGDDVEVAIAGTQLECAQLIGGNYTTSCSIPYDPVAHRFLRLHGANGMISWETSPDGMTWTSHGQAVPPIPLASVQLSVAAGTNGAPAASTVASFGTFNVLPP